MSAAAAFDAEMGELLLPADRVPAILEPNARARTLAELGLGGLQELDARLAAAFAAVDLPRWRLDVTRDGVAAQAWVGEEALALLRPVAPDTVGLRCLTPAHVPGLLAELLLLEPRLPADGPPLPVPAGVLASALATRATAGLQPPPGAPPLDPRAAQVLADLGAHWRVSSRWQRPDGEPAGRSIEILEAAGAYWQITAADPDAILTPVRPTAIFRGFARLAPTADELAPLTRPA